MGKTKEIRKSHELLNTLSPNESGDNSMQLPKRVHLLVFTTRELKEKLQTVESELDDLAEDPALVQVQKLQDELREERAARDVAEQKATDLSLRLVEVEKSLVEFILSNRRRI